MFSFVTKEVRLITKNAQRPYKYASLENIVCLTGPCQAAPAATSVIDPIQQAELSAAQELQIASQTHDPDALESYLQKHPESQRRAEISETISSLRRSEFGEWTLYDVGEKRFPQLMKLNSIQPLGTRVAVRQKQPLDTSKPLRSLSGEEITGEAYGDNVTVYDCEEPISAVAETTVLSKSGETLYHYKWADPQYLNLSIGVALMPGSVGLTARNIVCHDDLRTPLVTKRQLASMAFASVSSTLAGDGEIFYAPVPNVIRAQDQRELLFIIKFTDDRKLEFPGVSADLPIYRTEIDRIKLQCTTAKIFSSKTEYYNASNDLVYLTAPDPSAPTNWQEFGETSPISVLQQIVCQREVGGIGIQVLAENDSFKIVKVVDEKPAARVGLKVDDVITYVDDQPLRGLTLNQVVQKLRGLPNTKINLRIDRKGEHSPLELSVMREIIEVGSAQR
jgi:hypothetical protein